MARRPLIAANWKMYKVSADARSFLSALLPKIASVRDRDVLICPPYPLIGVVDAGRRDSAVLLGAQNMHFEEKGAFTGEVSAAMLKDLHCEFVILGHSERRWVFGETDEMINKKVLAAIQAGLIPVLCVGERLDEREKSLTEQVILEQLDKNLKGVPESAIGTMVIAYEPVWAIGTGKNATPDQAQEVIQSMRKTLAKITDAPTAENMRILYGGSVSEEKAKGFLKQPDIDGLLVGGASLHPQKFAAIIRATEAPQ